MHTSFLFIDILILLAPILVSFFIKMQFYRKWKFAIIGIGFASLLFVIWDMFFTRLGVWTYNPEQNVGLYVYNLPFEDVLFYLVIAYTSLYIYECLRVFFPEIVHPKLGKLFGWLIVTICSITLFNHYDQIFTSVTALLLIVTYLNHLWVTRGDYLWHLFLAWIITTIPMMLIYGFLTGIPILIFENEYILGYRLGPIPIELFFQNLLFLTWMIWIYERYKQRPAWKSLENADIEPAATQ